MVWKKRRLAVTHPWVLRSIGIPVISTLSLNLAGKHGFVVLISSKEYCNMHERKRIVHKAPKYILKGEAKENCKKERWLADGSISHDR